MLQVAHLVPPQQSDPRGRQQRTFQDFLGQVLGDGEHKGVAPLQPGELNHPHRSAVVVKPGPADRHARRHQPVAHPRLSEDLQGRGSHPHCPGLAMAQGGSLQHQHVQPLDIGQERSSHSHRPGPDNDQIRIHHGASLVKV